MIAKGRMKLCSCLLTANLLFIWGNSLLPANISGAISGWVKDLLWFLALEGNAADAGDNLVRKTAHLLEFCLLGCLLSWLFGMLRQTKWAFALPAFGCGCLVACLDEMLQYFAPGRSPGITDVIIDISGVALGMILFLAGHLIRKKRKHI